MVLLVPEREDGREREEVQTEDWVRLLEEHLQGEADHGQTERRVYRLSDELGLLHWYFSWTKDQLDHLLVFAATQGLYRLFY